MVAALEECGQIRECLKVHFILEPFKIGLQMFENFEIPHNVIYKVSHLLVYNSYAQCIAERCKHDNDQERARDGPCSAYPVKDVRTYSSI